MTRCTVALPTLSLVALMGCATTAANEPLPDGSAPRDLGTGDASIVGDAGALPDLGATTDAATVTPDASASGPTRYFGDDTRSPIGPGVVSRMRAIAQTTDTLWDDVFMKVGASGTVSPSFLRCFAGAGGTRTDLDGRTSLASAISHFSAGSAAGTDPFQRASLAAESGRSASWAVGGSPSPVDREFDALLPQFAFVNYGTNDMNQGTSPAAAMPGFYDNMNALLDRLESRGVVPIIAGLNPRSDATIPAQWVPTYDALTLAMAEARQLPYISLYRATRGLPNQGLVADGIHGNVYTESGTAQPCVFTSAALQFNYNVRNLLSIETLADVWSTVSNNAPAPETGDTPIAGTGTPADPFLIDRLPFTHFADTARSPSRLIDNYTAGCSASQNESGPEYYYRLVLPAETRARFVVMDLGTTDVDVHVLNSSNVCQKRGHHLAQGTFAAGTYNIVVDTFVSASGTENSGEYAFVAIACEPGDADCN